MTSKRLHYVLTALLLVAFQAQADTHYVSVNSTNPVSPYTNWATAANVIQDAVDAAAAGDTVLVTNGVYGTGGKAIHGTMTNRVAVDRAITLQSLMGPEVTIIEGFQVPGTTNGDEAVRCVYLTNGASLSGFTLSNGATRTYPSATDHAKEEAGGGVWSESASTVVTNCIVTGNSARWAGGGAFGGTLRDCVVSGNNAGLGAGVYDSRVYESRVVANTAPSWGFSGAVAKGALSHCLVIGNSGSRLVSDASLNNCIVVGNTGQGAINCAITNCTIAGNSGVGVSQSHIRNSIVYYNSGQNYGSYSVFIASCSTPLPSTGTGNITNAPLFMDTNGWADLRLQSNSPCINAGNNAHVTTATDLDGNPRIKGGTVDMGAYEFQDPQSSISYAYLQQYGLPTDGSVDDLDGDGDKATTWLEWKMWTDPTNGLSVLRMLHPTATTNGTEVAWQSVDGHTYTLERAKNGSAEFRVLQSGIAGQAGTTVVTDTTATNGNAFLYRVSVPE